MFTPAKKPDGVPDVAGLDATATQPAVTADVHRKFAAAWFSRTFESLAARNFRLLWIGMLLSMGGMQMQMVARGILVYQITDDAIITGLVAMGFAPTMLTFSLFGGVLGDKVERRILIQAGQAANALLAGLIAISILTGSIHWSHLFITSLAQGALFAFQMPARQAAIPKLVGKDRLSNAIALNAMAMSLMTLVAPAIGGGIYALSGAEGVYLVITGMNLVAVVFTSMIPKMYPDPGKAGMSVLQNIRAGFAYIWSRPLVRLLLIQGIVVALLSMPFRMLVQVYAIDVYGSGPVGIGLLLAMAGLGGVAGSLAIASLRRGQKRGAVLLGSAVLSGVALLSITMFPVYIVGLVAMAGIGLGESGRWALGQSLIMEETSDEFRARVMSVMMMTFGFMPLGVMPLSAAIAEFGARPAVAGMAILLLVISTLFILTQPMLRRLP